MEGNKRNIHYWNHSESEHLLDDVIEIIRKGLKVILFAFSLMFWIFILGAHDSYSWKLLLPELIGNGIVLAGNLFVIFCIGYDDTKFSVYLKITYCVAVIVSIVALYVGGVDMLVRPSGEKLLGLFEIIRFVIYAEFAIIMASAPSWLDCCLMWVIVKIFGKERT